MTLLPLLAMFGMIGLTAGLFGLYLARMLHVDGLPEDAAETRHNAQLLVISALAMLVVSMARLG